ncbi:MAG: hypothetical protein V1816_19060 [Pseudomonadota bacterium]
MDLIKHDLLSVCDPSLFPRGKTNLIYLADMAMSLDLGKFKAIWTVMQNEFPAFANDRELRGVFQNFLTRAAGRSDLGPLYDANEFQKLIPFLSNNQKIQVAFLFGQPLPDLAKLVLEITSLDNLQFRDMNEAVEFGGAVRDLVPEKIPALVKRLAEIAVHAGSLPFSQIRELFQPLSMSDDSIIEAMIQADRSIYGDSPTRSKWINVDLLRAASQEFRRKNLTFLKERYGAHENILAALREVDLDSFNQYLDFMYANHNTLLTGTKFQNNLYSFTAWRRGPAPLLANDINFLPWNIFLIHFEARKAAPDPKKLHELMAPIDSMLSEYSRDREAAKNNFADFLIYHQVTQDSQEPELQRYNRVLAVILEKEIKTRLEAIKGEMSIEAKALDSERERLKARLWQMTWQKTKAVTRLIALAILLFIQLIYIPAAFWFSVKYAFHLLLGRTAQRAALFSMIFLETFAKFMLPTLILFPAALAVIVIVQAFALLCGPRGGFPTIVEAVESYNRLTQAIKEPPKQAE